MAKVKQVVSEKEISIKIQEFDVVVLKNSNMFKVGEKVSYLEQIVWTEVTEEVIEEITKKLLEK